MLFVNMDNNFGHQIKAAKIPKDSYLIKRVKLCSSDVY